MPEDDVAVGIDDNLTVIQILEDGYVETEHIVQLVGVHDEVVIEATIHVH